MIFLLISSVQVSLVLTLALAASLALVAQKHARGTQCRRTAGC
jgi:hypothetical protein